MLFRDVNLELMNKVLGAASLRHKVIANNIANVNTPGYRSKEVAFDKEFEEALGNGRAEDALRVEPKLFSPDTGTTRMDGNNVDMEKELARLQKNATIYNVIAQMIGKRLASYKEAIGGSSD